MKKVCGVILACAALLITVSAGPHCAFASGRSDNNVSISIDAADVFLHNSITGITIKDAQELLGKGFPGATVTVNNPGAAIHIVIAGSKGGTGDGYEWASSRQGSRIVAVLSSPSFQGLSSGLYGLLQEKLRFEFYHPKRTIIPFYDRWPLPPNFHWKALPRFSVRGFHIHTLHPIELTEQLHNPGYPHAAGDIREYINWLARNGQNTFQFYLLRDIDRPSWIRHAAGIVEYAHKRGISTGVELSLFKIQQKAFQAIRLISFSSYRRQIDDTLAWLFKAKWDFITFDFSMGEYLPDLEGMMPDLKTYIIDQVTQKYHAKIMVPTHVIEDHSSRDQLSGDSCPWREGVLIHSVMFYSIDEAHAPVYGNINIRHMLAAAIHDNKLRETWFWPESAYWVCFDNSVPMLLLPYLDARWADMNTMKRIGVDKHLTFSSGWEWGYWLIDWSIARWSWAFTENSSECKTSPLNVLHDLFPYTSVCQLFQRALVLQEHYLKDRNLIAFMSALDPSAELPWPFDSPFQPRPPFSAKWLVFNASAADAERATKPVLSDLDNYAREMNSIVERLELETALIYAGKNQVSPEVKLLAHELARGLEITALRARHRALTIRALLAQRRKKWADPEAEKLLEQAAAVRLKALVLVRQQEGIYRYPVSLIARKRADFTAYHFGYLYPASDLLFWRREEEEARHRRFDAFYMNIWNFWRISGIGTLFP